MKNKVTNPLNYQLMYSNPQIRKQKRNINKIMIRSKNIIYEMNKSLLMLNGRDNTQ